jgi:hypothetical protein
MTDQHPTDGGKPDSERPDGQGRHAPEKHHADRHHAEKHHEPKPADEETAAVVSLDTAGGAMEPSAVPATAQSGKIPVGPETLVRRIFTGSGMVSVLAVLLALILGGLLIALTDKQVGTTTTYLLAPPPTSCPPFGTRPPAPMWPCSRVRCSTHAGPESADSSRHSWKHSPSPLR